MSDEQVNHPDHYNQYPVEVIEMMVKIFGVEAVYHFCLLNAFKYRMRMGMKINTTALKDLQKEKWYLDMAEVYKLWRNPPEFELYDLKIDPLEFKNLSEKPEYKQELEHLKKVLKQWQTDTKDPFNDPVKLQRFNADIKNIVEKYEGISYRRDPAFKWEYVEYFRD